MRSMTDFIMEQEASTSLQYQENIDLEILRSYMEMTAMAAVAECYCEHAAIADFCESEGFSVFTESSDGLFNKVVDSVGNFLKNIWAWIKNLVTSIVRFFTAKRIDKCIVRLHNEFKDDEKIQVPNTTFMKVAEVLRFIDKFKDEIDPDNITADNLDSFINEYIPKFEEEFKSSKKAGFPATDMMWDATASELADELEYLNKINVASTGRKLLKDLEFDKKKIKVKDKDGNPTDVMDKESVKKIKKIASKLANIYDKWYDSAVKVTEKILKDHYKKELASDIDEYQTLYDERHPKKKAPESPEPETTTEYYTGRRDSDSYYYY